MSANSPALHSIYPEYPHSAFSARMRHCGFHRLVLETGQQGSGANRLCPSPEHCTTSPEGLYRPLIQRMGGTRVDKVVDAYWTTEPSRNHLRGGCFATPPAEDTNPKLLGELLDFPVMLRHPNLAIFQPLIAIHNKTAVATLTGRWGNHQLRISKR